MYELRVAAVSALGAGAFSDSVPFEAPCGPPTLPSLSLDGPPGAEALLLVSPPGDAGGSEAPPRYCVEVAEGERAS